MNICSHIFSKSFIVLAPIFRFVIHLEFSFCVCCELGVHLRYFACGFSVVLTSCVEKSILSPLNGLGTLGEKSVEHKAES